MEEYFKAKRELLMEGESYRDIISAYPAYWSGLRRLELVILMDARVLGRIWPCQIMGSDPQIEEWAADTAPDVETLQKLLSNLENQRAVWPQIRAFRGRGSRGQREERDISQSPPRVTESEGESYPGPAANHGQGPGAATVAAISNQPVAPLQPGGAEQGSPDTRGVAGEVSETRAAAPGVLPGAAQGGLGPRGGGDLLGGPQSHRGRGSQQQERGEPLHSPWERQNPVEEGRGWTRL